MIPVSSCLDLCMLGNFTCFCSRLQIFFQIYSKFFKKLFQEQSQSVKLFMSRSGPTFCRSRSGSKPVCEGYQQTTQAGQAVVINHANTGTVNKQRCTD